ncbi:hypothetical protein KBI51_09800 [Aerococcaceae bacterium zg-ZUI334]|uniref:hypothetical protein n=1 Tax=Aerococcaceae bacterium zg-252 TaxID=2796928 RepID=UPI001B9BBF50|nr:hypothetical protein [Aerococcaceae bacterium zg-ZUI334]
MTVYLFEKNTKSFNGQGLGALVDLVEDVEVTETVRGFFELKFTYALNGLLADEIKEEAYVQTRVNEIQEDYLAFRIYEVEPDYIEHIIHVQARLAILDDMRNTTVIGRSYELAEIVSGVLAPLLPNYRVTGSAENQFLATREDDTVFNLMFDEEGLITQNKITPWYIDGGIVLNRDRGNKHDVLTQENYLEKFTVNKKRQSMVTQIIPYTTTRTDVLTPAENDRYNRETIETKVYGDMITSNKVADLGYPIVTRFMEFKNEVAEELEKGDTKYNRYKFESVDDLNAVTGGFFTENPGVDEYDITATVETLGLTIDEYKVIGSLNLYDIVTFYIQEYDLEIDLMVVEKTFNASTGWTSRLVFESNSETLQRAGQRVNAQAPDSRELSRMLQDNNFMNQMQNYILGEDGKKRWYTDTLPDPSKAKEGDVVFLKKDGKVSIWVFKDGEWVEELPLNFEQIIEDKFKDIETSIKTTEAEIEKIHARNEEELEKFREELKSLDLSEEKIEAITKKINLELPDFDALKSQIESVRESSRVNAEMIGSDGKTRYSKNILIGEVDRKLLFTDDHITIEANDGGFKKGQTYTISFEALCELLAKAKVNFNFGREAVRGVTMTLTPSSSKLTTVQTGSKTVDVLPGDYTVLMTSGWYKRYSQEVRIEKDTTIDILTEYREIAEGNRTMAYQGEWSENPELILDGGVS